MYLYNKKRFKKLIFQTKDNGILIVSSGKLYNQNGYYQLLFMVKLCSFLLSNEK